MGESKLPSLNGYKLLDPGIHKLTLEQIEALFGRFQGNDRRPQLMRKLREFVSEVRKTGWEARILVDGSFVMAQVDRPDDIDIILVMPGDWDFKADLRPFEYNLLWGKRTRVKYGFDVFAVTSGSPREARLVEFFQVVNVKWRRQFQLPFGLRKGIVKVMP